MKLLSSLSICRQTVLTERRSTWCHSIHTNALLLDKVLSQRFGHGHNGSLHTFTGHNDMYMLHANLTYIPEGAYIAATLEGLFQGPSRAATPLHEGDTGATTRQAFLDIKAHLCAGVVQDGWDGLIGHDGSNLQHHTDSKFSSDSASEACLGWLYA